MVSYPQGMNVADTQNSGAAGGQPSISDGPSITVQGEVSNNRVPNALTDINTTATRTLQARQRMIDDLNNIRTARNMSRLARRNEGVEGVSDDEDFMTMDEFLSLSSTGERGTGTIRSGDNVTPENPITAVQRVSN